jgi:hypothetical protein
MAAGDHILNADGTHGVKSDGTHGVKDGSDACAQCCDPLEYRQFRRCTDDVLVDLWGSAGPVDYFVRNLDDGECYWQDADDPASTTPGTLIGSHIEVGECYDPCEGNCADCTDSVPPRLRLTLTGMRDCCFEPIGGGVNFKVEASVLNGTYTLTGTDCCWSYLVPSGVVPYQWYDATDADCNGDVIFSDFTGLEIIVCRTATEWTVLMQAGSTDIFFSATVSAEAGDCSSPFSTANECGGCGHSPSGFGTPYCTGNGGTVTVTPL